MCLIVGWPGIAAGCGIFLATWFIVWLRTPKGSFTFDATDGSFEKLLTIYLDIAKFILGLAAGGIVLIIGSTALGSTKRLPQAYGSPLFLLVMSILYGIVFMPLLVLNYEAFQHKTSAYSRWRYVRNRTLGYSALSCFCFGYAWLIWAATTG